MFINELRQHIGEEVEIIAFLKDVKFTVNGTSSWCDLMVNDKTGTASFKVWDEAMSGLEPSTLAGKVCLFKGMIDLYKGSVGMNVVSICPWTEGTYNIGDFFPSLSEGDVEQLMQKCISLIDEVSDESLRALLIQTIGIRTKKIACKTGGTKHHTYIGGLLAHLVQVAEIAKAAAVLQCGPYATQVNLDLVVAGSLLHDIGKLTTLEDEPGKLTERGFYLDSPNESLLYVTMYNNKLGDNRVMNLGPLDHIILSCRRDCKPRTLEAIIVSNADQMSNRMDSFGLAFAGGEEKDQKGDSVISYSREIGCYLVRKREEG